MSRLADRTSRIAASPTMQVTTAVDRLRRAMDALMAVRSGTGTSSSNRSTWSAPAMRSQYVSQVDLGVRPTRIEATAPRSPSKRSIPSASSRLT